MTTIRKIVTSKIDGNDANSTNTSEIRPFGEAAFYIDYNWPSEKPTLMIFDGVRNHRDSKVLAPGILWGSNADAGDGSQADTIKLIPDAELFGAGSDQYIVVDPTGGEPGHIHLRAGGTQDSSGADLYLGGEKNFVRISDTNDSVTIKTTFVGEGETNYFWTFSDTGTLTIPGGSYANDTSDIHSNNSIRINGKGLDGVRLSWENAITNLSLVPAGEAVYNNVILANNGITLQSIITDGTNIIPKNWVFNNTGDLELPGGGALATNSYDVALLAGNDGNSTFGSVTINTQFPAATYTVTQEGGFVAGPGANTITGNILYSPSASSIVAGMTVTGLNLIGVTTVTSATVDMSGNFTILTDADEVDPFAYGEVYTFTGAQPQDRNWEFNSLGELNLPQGGAIQETSVTNELWGTTTTSLTLVPGGAGNGTQRLEIYATGGGEGDHIHIRSGDQNQTDLFLGNDTQYFAVAASGANYIQARNGAASTGPGVSAGAGANVNVYGGNAGDNGGNAADGNSGGDVFIASGISTAGLGGQIYLQTSSGPTGFGSIKLSTDGGSSYLEFNEANQLVFPDSTVQTTAYTGNAAAPTVDILNTNGIDTNYSITFVETRDTAQILRADVNLTWNSWSNILGIGSLSFSGEPLKLVSTAPSSSAGTTGDKKGNIHYGHEYFYYCLANYAGGGKEVTVQASNTTFVHINKSDYPNLETLKSGNPGTWTITDGTNTYNINSVTTSGLIADAWELQLAANPDPDFANGSTAVINASSYTYPIWRRLQWSTLPW